MTTPTVAGPTVGGLTLRILARYPQRVALVDADGRETTYAAAADLIGRYQRVLVDRGLTRGSRVALLSANRTHAWCASIAAQASGMGITWLHPLASLEDQRYQIEHSASDAVIVDEQTFSRRGSELGAEFSFGPADFGTSLSLAAAGVGPCPPRDCAEPSDVAIVNYTGGTTGKPKGVLRRHGALAAVTASILADFEIPETPRYLAVAPNSHVGGTMILPVLARGGTVYLQLGFDPAAVLDAIASRQVNVTLLVPTMIYALLDDPALDSTDTSTLEVLLYGAAPMAPSRLADGLRRLGPVFAQFYGQTEYHPISYLSRSDHAESILQGSCGFPTTSTSVRLLDESGNDAASGGVGELAVRGPAALESYYKQDSGLDDDGWVRTGDVATIDDRGYLRIVDRKKDMIISGGFNVYPREVEDVLFSHPDVALAAVYGVPDDRWGEVVVAAVVLTAGASADSAALIAHVKRLKGSLHAPKELRFVGDLPRTALGKIDKKALRDGHGCV